MDFVRFHTGHGARPPAMSLLGDLDQIAARVLEE
jgi:hypothetical protein